MLFLTTVLKIYFHSSAPCIHSWRRPAIKIKRKKAVKIDKLVIIVRFIITGIGKIIVISTSKIKNTTAIKKNRMEKGMRAFEAGSNPHSNAEGFSRSWKLFLAIPEFKKISATGSTTEIKITKLITQIRKMIF